MLIEIQVDGHSIANNLVHPHAYIPFFATSGLNMHIIINGKPRYFENETLSLAGLVTALDLQGKRLAIERNGEIVPRSQFADTQLLADDKLEIVGAVGGG